MRANTLCVEPMFARAKRAHGCDVRPYENVEVAFALELRKKFNYGNTVWNDVFISRDFASQTVFSAPEMLGNALGQDWERSGNAARNTF